MEVRDIVSRVSRHFYDLVDEDANPLVVALALQDNSSVGLQHFAGEFAQLHEELRQSLKVRVDANYQGFNTSVGVYHSVVSALKSGHEDFRNARERLNDVHNQMVKRRPMLKELQQKSALYKRKLEILADLEEIQSVPPRYEDCVARKQFREAQSLLSYALEKINSRDLLRHAGIRPLYTYLASQQSQLYNRVIDELRAHIFLSSPYAQRRALQESTDYESFMRRLPSLPEAPSDSRESPESNSFSYLVLLGETLAAMHRLRDGVDEVVKKTAEDLHQLTRRVTASVVADLKLSLETLQRAAQHGGTLIEQFKAVDQGALSTLASTLYTQLVAVLEGYRALIEIAAHFGVRYSLDSVYTAVIDEAREFLLNYIGGDETPVLPLRPRSVSDAHSMSRVSKSRLSGSVFEFGDGDEDSRGLRDFDALRTALKSSVPGLLTDDPHHLFADTQQQQGMEVVAPAHILNIRPLLEPSVTFFSRAETVVKGEAASKEFGNFLDKFLQQAFVPRLRQAFDNAIDAIGNDDNALSKSDIWPSRSQLPIMECVIHFADTIGLLCQLLDMGSSFREDYASILIGLLAKTLRFFNLRTKVQFGAERRTGKIWTLATSTHFSRLLHDRYSGKPHQHAEFAEYFAQRLRTGASKPSLTLGDLLDVSTYAQASLLITSIRWLALLLRKMRRVTSAESPRQRDSTSVAVRRRWMLLDAPVIKEGAVALQRTFVTLGGKTLAQYDSDVTALDSLALQALAVLRTDVFCRIVYYFDQMVNERDFHSNRRREERDPVVDRLQRELSHIAQVADANLISADREFLLGGVAQFMNELFILEGENIRDMSEFGQSQMLTNIFALQQMLTSIVSDPRDVDFSRATSFYELFRLGPSIIVERVRMGETDMEIQDIKLLLSIRHRRAGSSAAGTLADHHAAVDEIFKLENAPTPLEQPEPPVAPLRTRSFAASPSKPSAPNLPERRNSDAPARSTSKSEELQKQEAARRASEAKALESQRRERKIQKEAEARQREEARLQLAREEAARREAAAAKEEEIRQSTTKIAGNGANNRSREALNVDHSKNGPQPLARSTEPGHQAQAEPSPLAPPRTRTAVPAPAAVKSTQLNPRMHNEQTRAHQPQQPHQQQQAPAQPLPTPPQHQPRLEQPPQPPQHLRRPNSPARSSAKPPPIVVPGPEPLTRVRTRPSGSSLRSQASSPPVTPTAPPMPSSPNDETRPRTPSERALEAAQRVRQRPMPQPVRRTK